MVFYLNGMTEGASYQTAMVTRGDDVTIRISEVRHLPKTVMG